MFKITKRGWALCLALLLVLSMLPAAASTVSAAEVGKPVESTLDFTSMNSISEGAAASKNLAKQALLDAGAVDVDNLFLVGNLETIVNPGGYNGPGYFVQKAEAAAGETIHNASLYLDYYLCVSDPQGYIEVYVSADNQNYEKVFEQKEGKGEGFSSSSKNSVTVTLPVSEGQSVIYVKVVMEHWNTYEGAAVARSTIALNSGSEQSGPVTTDKTPEECTMVTVSHNFNGLAFGEVTAEEIGAVEESNMYFGIDGVTLLSPRNGYETASATWLLTAAEGEPLNDCVLTIVGRTYFITENVKDDNYLKVYVSTDGRTYTEVHDFRANDNPDDAQRLTVDLTDAVKGYAQAYVKLEWLLFDSPHIFGIRSVTLTGNTAGIADPNEGPTNMAVSQVQSFTSLPVGPVDVGALNAFKSANLTFGYNKTPLLTASEAGEDAYVTWKLTAASGETFNDCYLMLVGRFGYINADKKDTSSMVVYLSTDGEKYSQIREITPTEDQSDKQQITIDLTAQTYGLSEIYVRVYWSSKDDPAGMGLRAMALVANAGADYEQFLPELEDRVITDGETQDPTENIQPTEGNEGNVTDPAPAGNATIWVIVAVVIIAAAVVVAVILLKKKASGKAEP